MKKSSMNPLEEEQFIIYKNRGRKKLKRNIFRIVIILLLGFTFWSIFGFSNQSGTASSGVSKKVARKIIDVFPYTRNLSENTKNKIVERAQPIIRKLAHFSIYTLVGILIMSFVSTYRVLLWKKWLISILVGLVYAISDEYHQSFIPGRSAQITDVLIDTSGVIFGIMIVLIVISVYKALGEKYKTMKSIETKK